jgi:hypothetical protein
VTFAEDDVVTISDTAANVQTLSAADIASLAAMGVSAVAASDGARAQRGAGQCAGDGGYDGEQRGRI